MEVAAELEADVPEDYFGPYHENDLQWQPDGVEGNAAYGLACDFDGNHCGSEHSDNMDKGSSSGGSDNDIDESGSSGDGSGPPSSNDNDDSESSSDEDVG